MSGPSKKPPSPPNKAADNKKHINDLLDEALDETFPASDPPAMLEPAPGAPRKSPDGSK